MRLYLAGSAPHVDLITTEGWRDVLIAYPEVRKSPKTLERLAAAGCRVFLDCGAWSVFSGAVPPIDVAEYARWVKDRAGAFAAVAALDVIGDHATTRRNYETMRSAGVECLPTWHAGEPHTIASSYARASTRMAVGGLAAMTSTAKVGRAVAGVWPHLGAARVHLFGVSNLMVIHRFRPDSADSTTWLVGHRFGKVLSARSNAIVQVAVQGPNFTRAAALEVAAEAHRFDMSVRELQSRDARLRYNIRVLKTFVDRVNAAPAARSVA